MSPLKVCRFDWHVGKKGHEKVNGLRRNAPVSLVVNFKYALHASSYRFL